MITDEKTVHAHRCDLCGETITIDCSAVHIGEHLPWAEVCGSCDEIDPRRILRRLATDLLRLRALAGAHVQQPHADI